MILKIKKEKLKEGISIVEKTSAKAISLPILKNLIIRAKKNIVNISATDLEIGIQWWSIAKIEEEGEVVIPASILSTFINLLPEGVVILSSSGNNLNIECGEYKTQIKGFSSEDFPIIPDVPEKKSTLINSNKLCSGLSQIVNIPLSLMSKPEISGVLFSFSGNELKLVATDSYRLGEKTLLLETPVESDFSFIIPQKSVKEIINIFIEKEGNLKILLGLNQVLFELSMTEMSHPKIQLTSRQIEGDYPNYEEIIPKKNKIKAVLDRKELINQIKASSIFSGKVNEVIIDINSIDSSIKISSQSIDSGEYSSSIYGEIDGGKEKVSFNYRYLIDGLLSIKDPKILFQINGSDSPGVFKALNDSSFLYIVMPIKASQ